MQGSIKLCTNHWSLTSRKFLKFFLFFSFLAFFLRFTVLLVFDCWRFWKSFQKVFLLGVFFCLDFGCFLLFFSSLAREGYTMISEVKIYFEAYFLKILNISKWKLCILKVKLWFFWLHKGVLLIPFCIFLRK